MFNGYLEKFFAAVGSKLHVYRADGRIERSNPAYDPFICGFIRR